MTRLVSLLLVMAGVCLAAQAPPPTPSSPARGPHVVFVTGDDEYRSEISMPMIAAILEERHGLRTRWPTPRPTPQTKDHIDGLEALETADLMVMFTRYRALPDAELNRILAYVKSGKPIVGFRTSTHAFNYPAGSPHTDLNDGFGLDVFGQKWITHHGHRSTTTVALRSRSRQPSDPAGRDAVRGQVVAVSRHAAATGRRRCCSTGRASTPTRRPGRTSSRPCSPSPGRASTRAGASSSRRSGTRGTSRSRRCGG